MTGSRAHLWSTQAWAPPLPWHPVFHPQGRKFSQHLDNLPSQLEREAWEVPSPLSRWAEKAPSLRVPCEEQLSPQLSVIKGEWLRGRAEAASDNNPVWQVPEGGAQDLERVRRRDPGRTEDGD